MRVSVVPTAQQSSYSLQTENILRFPIKGPFIEGHSIRLSADIIVTNDASPPVPIGGANSTYNGIFLSPLIGAHSLIDGLILEMNTANGSEFLEQVNNYSYFAASVLGATESGYDAIRTAKSSLELRCGHNSTYAAAFMINSANDNGEGTHLTFSLKPFCSLTKLPIFDGSKNYVLTFRTAVQSNFLVNTTAPAINPVITLKNVYLSYETWDAKAGDDLMRSEPKIFNMPYITANTLTVPVKSPQENISLNVNFRGTVIGWMGIFLPNDVKTSMQSDNFGGYQPPGLSRIRFLMNGQDFGMKFPYILASKTFDPLLLYEQAQNIATLVNPTAEKGKDKKCTGIMTARDRDQNGSSFIIGERYDPGVVFDGSSTVLSVEIWSDIMNGVYSTPWTAYISFIILRG